MTLALFGCLTAFVVSHSLAYYVGYRRGKVMGIFEAMNMIFSKFGEK